MNKAFISILIINFFIGICFITLSGCTYQGQEISRLTENPIKIKLSETCVSNYQFSFVQKTYENTTKYVTCKDKDGNFITKEYNNLGIL